MKRYILNSKVNKVLITIKKQNGFNSLDFLEIEIKELIDLGFIEINNKDFIIDEYNVCSITNEGEKFLKSYKGLKKVEYFFQDFPFLGSLIVGFIGGFIGGIFSLLIFFIS